MHSFERPELRKHFLFAALTDEQFVQIVHSMRVVQLQKGESLFRHGEQARYFYLLENGLIELYRLSPMGEEKVIEIISPGHTFAEAVMFLDYGAYPVSARALVKSVVLGFEMTIFRNLLRESPATCLHLLGGMSQRLHQLVQEVDQLSLQNSTTRVAKFLLQAVFGEGIENRVIVLTVPKHVLASRLSLRPETLSRILRQWDAMGFIHLHGKTVKILDLEALSRLAE